MSTTHIMTDVGEVETHIGSRSGVGMGGKWNSPTQGSCGFSKGKRSTLQDYASDTMFKFEPFFQ